MYSQPRDATYRSVKLICVGVSPLTPTPTATATPTQGLWVANFGGNVTEYGLPLGGIAATAPTIDIFGANTMLFDSTGIAVGSDGDIYVTDETNGMGGTGDIIVFGKSSNGNASPGHEITGIDTELDHPDGIAVDALNQNVYVANASGGSCTSPWGSLFTRPPAAAIFRTAALSNAPVPATTIPCSMCRPALRWTPRIISMSRTRGAPLPSMRRAP